MNKCLFCGKETKNSKFCSRRCNLSCNRETTCSEKKKLKISRSLKTFYRENPDIRREQSEKRKLYPIENFVNYWLGKSRAGINNPAYGINRTGEKHKPCSEDTRSKIRIGRRKWLENGGYQILKESQKNPIVQEKKRIALLRNMQENPEPYRNGSLKGLQIIYSNRHMTKPEMILDTILQKYFPNEWKYVGLGEIFIAGKVPDFININGQKKLIELYGDYWHTKEESQERIAFFKQYGFDTLIIWESELYDQPILVFNKLASFL